jgi:hypothetical protein
MPMPRIKVGLSCSMPFDTVKTDRPRSRRPEPVACVPLISKPASDRPVPAPQSAAPGLARERRFDFRPNYRVFAMRGHSISRGMAQPNQNFTLRLAALRVPSGCRRRPDRVGTSNAHGRAS